LSKLKNINHLVAVSSGKGGVGKSTVAVNLALAISQLQKRAGLLDADIYGPSIPTMMNLLNDRPKVTEKNKIIPLVNYGIECMSMGFLVAQDAPTIWRGPMVMSALDQMLHEVEWGDLDVLVIDLPPGTGDAQLTLTQRTPLSGAVIVSTPQEVALADVRRGANMFRKVNVPLLGLIENMAYFEPPCGCNQRYYIFGEGGARKTAENMGINFLGEIPIDQSIRELCDSGKPSVAAQPDSPSAKIYRDIAQRILDQLETKNTNSGPTIVIED
jgi:ATP-binding protein involved in chromosome partitioning